MIALQITKLNGWPNKIEAKEAVTIVTAVWMVNIVARFKKNIPIDNVCQVGHSLRVDLFQWLVHNGSRIQKRIFH